MRMTMPQAQHFNYGQSVGQGEAMRRMREDVNALRAGLQQPGQTRNALAPDMQPPRQSFAPEPVPQRMMPGPGSGGQMMQPQQQAQTQPDVGQQRFRAFNDRLVKLGVVRSALGGGLDPQKFMSRRRFGQ